MNRDIFINALLPFINGNIKETDGQRLNRWAMKAVQWYEANKDKPRKEFATFQYNKVEDPDYDLAENGEKKIKPEQCCAYFFYESDELVPIDVWEFLYNNLEGYLESYLRRSSLMAHTQEKEKEQEEEKKGSNV